MEERNLALLLGQLLDGLTDARGVVGVGFTEVDGQPEVIQNHGTSALDTKRQILKLLLRRA